MANNISTKERILTTAFELFTSSSYDKVSIDDIIKKVGISKGGLFHHFKSKYELAAEALFHNVENLWMKPLSELDKIKNPQYKLKKFIDFSIDTILENPKMIKFFIDVYEEGLKHQEFFDDKPDNKLNNNHVTWQHFYHEFLEILSKMFSDCNIPNPHMKANILLVSLDAVGMESIFFGDSGEIFDPEILKQEFYELFVGNYEKPLKQDNRGA